MNFPFRKTGKKHPVPLVDVRNLVVEGHRAESPFWIVQQGWQPLQWLGGSCSEPVRAANWVGPNHMIATVIPKSMEKSHQTRRDVLFNLGMTRKTPHPSTCSRISLKKRAPVEPWPFHQPWPPSQPLWWPPAPCAPWPRPPLSPRRSVRPVSTVLCTCLQQRRPRVPWLGWWVASSERRSARAVPWCSLTTWWDLMDNMGWLVLLWCWFWSFRPNYLGLWSELARIFFQQICIYDWVIFHGSFFTA